MENFTKSYTGIMYMIDAIDPVAYARTRNYTNGAVTHLSPYISRGVISTRLILQMLLQKGYSETDLQRLIQEFAWREYFQRVWQYKGFIDECLRSEQEQVANFNIPTAILNANTGINAIDQAISGLYELGYVHNHLRMYIASLTCNLGKAHWHLPAQWMYYHLLDGDWASNACSWQWVAGCFSAKKYVFNQENLNQFTGSQQTGTFIDKSYEEIGLLQTPSILEPQSAIEFKTVLPDTDFPLWPADEEIAVHTVYNLDPAWRVDTAIRHILLLEPELFNRYPVDKKVLDFYLQQANQIPDIVILSCSFQEMKNKLKPSVCYFKEHPLNRHFEGTEDSRDWLFPEITGFFPSFSKYWKQCAQQTGELLQQLIA